MILLDASGLIAFLNEAGPHHAEAIAAMRASRPPRFLSPFVLAEVDYLLATRIGQRAEFAFLDEIAGGAYTMAPFGPADVAEARDVIEKYGDADVGLTDASLVVLARRYGTRDVLTLDERHFRILCPEPREHFRVLPADMP